MTGKIPCKWCEMDTHSISHHIAKEHPDRSVEQYALQHPNAPMESPAFIQAKAMQARHHAQEMQMASSASNVISMAPATGMPVKKIFHEVFNLEPKGEALSLAKKPVQITCVEPGHDQEKYVPKIDEQYVFEAEETKNLIIGLELNIPSYVFGHKGSGKTELYEQVAARTGRPYTRQPHTINMEESQVVGQWTARGGDTVFQLGPLPNAMLHGHLYVADEYDRAPPTVNTVYQSVLEGKSLVIRDAPPEFRVIEPHPMFRFGATGNTNGSGDASGLYGSTMIQDSANISRFGLMIHKKYLSPDKESEILQRRKLTKSDSDRLVNFATEVRKAYDSSQISDIISPRELIAGARVGVARGSFRIGLQLAFIDKLSPVDREVVDQLAQRIFT